MSMSPTAAISTRLPSEPLIIGQTADNEEGLATFRKIVLDRLGSVQPSLDQTIWSCITEYAGCFDFPDYPQYVDLVNREDLNQRAIRIRQMIGRLDFSLDVSRLIAEYGPLLSQRILALKLVHDPALKNILVLHDSPAGFTEDLKDLFRNPEKILSQRKSLESVFSDRLLKEWCDLSPLSGLLGYALRRFHYKEDESKKILAHRLFKECCDLVPRSGELGYALRQLYYKRNDTVVVHAPAIAPPGECTERIREIVKENLKQPGNYELFLLAQMSETVMWDSAGRELSLAGYCFSKHHNRFRMLTTRTIISIDLFSNAYYAVSVGEWPPQDDNSNISVTSIHVIRNERYILGNFPVFEGKNGSSCITLGFPNGKEHSSNTAASETAVAVPSQPRQNSWWSWITGFFSKRPHDE